MKNTVITIIISSMTLFAANVFAFGKESKNANDKSKKEILKFRVNDFVGTEDSGANENDSLESQKIETLEKTSGENKESSSDSTESKNIR